MNLQSITSTNTNGSFTTLLSSPILTFIDSTIPYIYLPPEVCEQFENTFGLIWNSTYRLYLIDENRHEMMRYENPNITFRIAESKIGPGVDIVLPYASFVLDAKSPFVETTARYFPLRKANNESQYTLGRAFLQEACVISGSDPIFPSRLKFFQLPNHRLRTQQFFSVAMQI